MRKYGSYYSFNNMGFIYDLQGQLKEALDCFSRALKISQVIGYPIITKDVAKGLSIVFEKQGNGMKALEMYKLHVQMKDSINNEATLKATIRQQTKYEFEKAQIVKENEAKEQARIQSEATGRRNNIQYSLIFLGILVLFGIILSLGFIKVSPNIAEGIIFFTFLLFFEFCLVLLDPMIEDWSSGEPLFKLLFNAGIAALIFPMHSLFEGKLKKRLVR